MSALPAAKEMLMLGARNSEAFAKGACAPTRVSPWRGVGEQMLSRRRGEGGGGSSRRPWLGGLRTPYLLVCWKKKEPEAFFVFHSALEQLARNTWVSIQDSSGCLSCPRNTWGWNTEHEGKVPVIFQRSQLRLRGLASVPKGLCACKA